MDSLTDESLSVVDEIKDSLTGILTTAIDYVPRIIAAIIVVIIGMIIAKIAVKVVTKLFGIVEDNSMVKNLLAKANLKQVKLGKIAGMITKWVVMIVFYTTAADLLDMAVLSDTIESILGYLPKIFGASIVGVIVYLASNIVSDLVGSTAKNAGIKIHKALSTASRVGILVFGIPLAAAQLGMNLDIINDNITVIVMGVVAAFALAFGLGGRHVASKILDDAYSKYSK